jgi:hypothetical protein
MDLNHYVYALLDPRSEEIFYIGKGQGARVLAHTNAAKNGEPDNEKEARIIDIQAQGLEVRNIILAKNFKTHDEALSIESLLIHEAKGIGTVLGIPCKLTNLVAGHHTSRFRPIDSIDNLVGFEYEPELRLPGEVKESYRELFERVLAEIPIFKEPNKIGGAYIRSHTLRNGFEFVVFPKSDRKIVVEYIKRRAEDSHREHAKMLRDKLSLKGSLKYAQVDFYDKSIDVFNVGKAIASINQHIERINEIDQFL